MSLGLRASSVAAAVIATFAACAALAEEPPPKLVEGDVTLDYRRGPGTAACPDEAALRERAADAFDFRDPFVAHGKTAAAHLRIEVERAGSAYQGKVLRVGDAGDTIASSIEEHADCDALVWLLAHRVALAVLRRPSSTAPAPATPATSASTEPALTVARIPVPLPTPASACDAACVEQRARAAPATPPAPRSPGIAITAGGLLTAGWTADVGPGAWLGASARFDRLSLGLELRGTFPARTLTFDAIRGASATTFSAALIPCAHWKIASGCLFVEAGAFLFLVPGSTVPVITDALVSVGPRLAIDVPLGAGFAARAFADLAAHPYLPIFTVRFASDVDSTTKRWTTPAVSGLFGLGLAWSR